MKYLQWFIYLFIFGLPGILTIPNPLDHLTINLNIDEKDCEEEGCKKKEIKTNDYQSSGCTESCTNFINSNGYGKCKKVTKRMKGPICYVNSASTCTDTIASTTDPGKYFSATACQKKVCTESCINYSNSRGFGLCKKTSKKMKGVICYVHSTSTCTDMRASTSDPGFFYSAQACKKTACTESCINFTNSRGFGQCKKVSKNMKGLICYVHSASTCTDIRSSTSDPGKYYSAQACKNKGTVTPGTSQKQCCGAKTVSRIVGGNDAEMNEYPWIGRLRILVQGEGWFSCGGSLIASQWLMTAHHCVNKVTSPYDIEVILGDHNKNIRGESSMEKSVSVSKMITPGRRIDWKKDIALLKLIQPVSLKIYTPICLPEQSRRNNYIKNGVWVYGWGTTDYGGRASNTLQKAQVYVVSNRECDNGFVSQGIPMTKIAPSQICAGTKTSPFKDSCQGDSGGPLSYATHGIHEQIGIVSYGMGCAVPGLYGVYTYVAYLRDWIENTVKNNGGGSLPSRC